MLLVLARRGHLTARIGERRFLWLITALSTLHLLLAAAVGHGAATEPSWLAQTGHAAHLLAAAVWAGGLPAIAYGLWLGARSGVDVDGDFFAEMLRRFSMLAGASVLCVVVSGLIIGYLQLGAPTNWPGSRDDLLGGLFTVLERVVAPLLGTPYGLQVLAKAVVLVSVLLLAARVKFVFLARLLSWMPHRRPVLRSAARWVTVEFGAVSILLVVAASLTATPPAGHEQVVWRLPIRWSAAATWDQPGIAVWVVVASLLMIASIVLGGLAWRRLRQGRTRPVLRRAWIASTGIVSSAAMGLWALSVPAYPDTYRRIETAYKAVSIARGAQLYQQHCVVCHGAGGKGDGPFAPRMKVPPANLTEPHTALHTAGDMFWWLTHGKPESGMPGFEAQTSVEDRWDLINFLRAFSAGHQARILTPRIVPNVPWLGAPDFDFGTTAGAVDSLKNFREKSSVLLVFYSLPQSKARLDQLATCYAKLKAANVEVIAVPMSGHPTAASAPRDMPFETVSDGALDASTTYLLFRRTLSNAGLTVLGEKPEHLEFLIDRFGFVRARWLTDDLPQTDADDWQDMSRVLRQVELLNRETRILPSPDEHVH
jgi:putative copper resistance protein D